MTQTPKRKPKKRLNRSHLPALTPEQLFALTEQLKAARIPAAAQAQIEADLKAAAAPGGETVDAAIRSLEVGRRSDIDTGVREMKARFASTVQRGNQALMGMSDEEWNRLLEESADD